jgi:cytidine deaminase
MMTSPDYEITSEHIAQLRAAAQYARRAHYAPYSNFMVLAAVDTSQGIFAGSNVENVNFTLTKHAEEVAVLAALLAGARRRRAWLKVLYVTSAAPCGSCRQFVSEFGQPETVVLIDRLSQAKVRRASLRSLSEKSIEVWRLGDLLPGAFSASDLPPS